MAKILSTDVNSVVQFATSCAPVSAELNRRDRDPALDCVYIKSTVTAIQEHVNTFEIIFNFGYIDHRDRRGEDIVVIVENSRGTLRLVNWHNQ